MSTVCTRVSDDPYGLTRTRAVVARAALIVAAAAAAATLPATAANADGTATVSVSVAADPSLANTAFTDQPTDLVVSGSGFQSIDKGFGGIYLLFGWVDSTGDWRPSAGGATGSTYRYQMDDEAKPSGYQQFISFPGGSTESQASGGDVAADGSWATTLTVQGPRFSSTDRDGNATTVDCRTEQCGVITIGAHGVANKNNETFTPVTFVAAASLGGPGASGGVAESQAAEGAGSPATPEPSMTTLAADAASGATAADPTATPVVTDASADAGSSGGAGWMIGSGIAVAALLGVGLWRLIVWRRRSGATPTPPPVA